MLFKDISEAFFKNEAKVRRKGWTCYWVWRSGTIYRVSAKEWFDLSETAYKSDVIKDLIEDDWEVMRG